MEKQKKKSRHSKQTHNRQYKDRLWRIVEQLFISDWDSRKVTDNKKRNILVLNYNNYCVKFSSQVNFTTKIGPFAWTNGPISFRDLFHSPLFLNNPLITCFKEESKATLESAPFLIRLSQMLSAHPQTSHNLNCQ